MGALNPKVGVAVSFGPSGNAIDDTIAHAQSAAQAGIGTIWIGQRFDYDAIAVAGLIAREVSDVGVGTSAVPIFSRHPLNVAAQAQTAQAAAHGRFQLGLALGAARLVQAPYGEEYRRPITRLEEFLIVIRQLLSTGAADFHGTEISSTTSMPTALPGATPIPPILVAALGPRALAVSGRLADGILPNLAGPTVLERQLIPALNTAAHEAGRPQPRVVALVPAVVSADADTARDSLTAAMSLYDTIPSYRRVLADGGYTHASDLALVGSPRQIREGLQRYFDVGATEVILTQTGLLGAEAQIRTWEAAAEIGR